MPAQTLIGHTETTAKARLLVSRNAEDHASLRSTPPSEPHEATGDVDAFEALFHAHYGALCEYVRHIVGSHDLAEELAQDAFVRLWERHTRAPATLAVPYLYTAARNRALSYLRHERVARDAAKELVRDAAESRNETASGEVLANDLAVAAERAIAELPERCRLIFLMSRREGLTYAEIARALDIAVSTVETQISRALKQLRTRLSPFLVLTVALQPAVDLARRWLH